PGHLRPAFRRPALHHPDRPCRPHRASDGSVARAAGRELPDASGRKPSAQDLLAESLRPLAGDRQTIPCLVPAELSSLAPTPLLRRTATRRGRRSVRAASSARHARTAAFSIPPLGERGKINPAPRLYLGTS